MTVSITLTSAGIDTGPFNLFSNADGYTTPFEVGVSRAALLATFQSANAPSGTTTVRVSSTGDCSNSIDIVLAELTTTTTSSSSSTTTTTSSSSTTTTTSSTTEAPATFTQYTIYVTTDGGGWATSGEACAATATGPITLYSNPLSTTFEEMISNGHSFYTDPSLQAQFLFDGTNGAGPGNAEWYKSVSGPNAGQVIQIDEVGAIQNNPVTC